MSQPSTNDLERQICEGVMLRKAQKLDDSINHFSRLAQRNPDDHKVLLELSISCRLARRFDKSQELLDRILESKPNMRDALLAKIDTYLHAGAFDDAASTAISMREFRPEDPVAILRHIESLRRAGRSEDGLAEIEKLFGSDSEIALSESLQRQLKVSQLKCLVELGKIRMAEPILVDLIANNPTDRDILYHAIAFYRAALNYSLAINYCNRALDIWPDDLRAVREKVSLLLTCGDALAAQRTLEASTQPHNDLWIRVFLALRQFRLARQRLLELKERESEQFKYAYLEIDILKNEGRLEDAYFLAEAIHKSDLQNQRAAITVIGTLAAMGKAKQAFDFSESLPNITKSSANFKMSYSNIVRILGDIETSTNFAIASARISPSILGHVRRLVSDAGQWGFGTSQSKYIMNELSTLLVERVETILEFTLDVLRLEIAYGTSNWDTVLELSERAIKQSPQDTGLLMFAARAAFERGEFDKAICIVETILSKNPASRLAVELRAALCFAVGDVTDGLYFLSKKVVTGDYAINSRDAEKFQFFGLPTELLSIVEKQISMSEGKAAAWLTNLRDLLSCDTHVRQQPSSQPSTFTPLTKQDMAGMSAEVAGGCIASAYPSTEALVAWKLQRRPEQERDAWINKATQATYINQILTKRSALEECCLPVEMNSAFKNLIERIRNREPMLLVGTHSGPYNAIALAPYLPNVACFVDARPNAHWLLEKYDIIDPSKGPASSQIVSKLRKGISVYFTPDFPAEMKWSPCLKSDAVGMLFGVPCSLVDTVPKISQAMNIPIYWIQALRSEKGIVPHIHCMSKARSGETSDAWLSRWTQEYLDLLAGFMTSDPENQNLLSPMNRYLAIKHSVNSSP